MAGRPLRRLRQALNNSSRHHGFAAMNPVRQLTRAETPASWWGPPPYVSSYDESKHFADFGKAFDYDNKLGDAERERRLADRSAEKKQAEAARRAAIEARVSAEFARESEAYRAEKLRKATEDWEREYPGVPVPWTVEGGVVRMKKNPRLELTEAKARALKEAHGVSWLWGYAFYCEEHGFPIDRQLLSWFYRNRGLMHMVEQALQDQATAGYNAAAAEAR